MSAPTFRPREMVCVCDRCKREGRSSAAPGGAVPAPDGWGRMFWERRGRPQRRPYVTSDTLRLVSNEGLALDEQGEVFLCPVCLNDALLALDKQLNTKAAASADLGEIETAFRERDSYRAAASQLRDLLDAITRPIHSARTVETETARAHVLLSALFPEPTK